MMQCLLVCRSALEGTRLGRRSAYGSLSPSNSITSLLKPVPPSQARCTGPHVAAFRSWHAYICLPMCLKIAPSLPRICTSWHLPGFLIPRLWFGGCGAGVFLLIGGARFHPQGSVWSAIGPLYHVYAEREHVHALYTRSEPGLRFR